MRIPKPTEKWKRFTGGIYVVVGLARNATTQEIEVVYFPEQEASELWTRSLDEWMELLRDKPFNYVAGQQSFYSGQRFVRVCPAL